MTWRVGILRSVLLAKDFDGAYVHNLMQFVCGGHTTINVNGLVGPLSPNGRGLRQGDPVSPILLNFVADVLSRFLNRVASSGHITPVVSHLILFGVSHFQYTDDTIILVESNNLCVANLNIILLYLEALFGLKLISLKVKLLSLVGLP